MSEADAVNAQCLSRSISAGERRRVAITFICFGWFDATFQETILRERGPHVFHLAPGEYQLSGTLSSLPRQQALLRIEFTTVAPGDDNGVKAGSIQATDGPNPEVGPYDVIFDCLGNERRPFKVSFRVT